MKTSVERSITILLENNNEIKTLTDILNIAMSSKDEQGASKVKSSHVDFILNLRRELGFTS